MLTIDFFRKTVAGWLLPALLAAGCAPNQQPDVLTLSGPFEFTSQDPARDGEVYQRLQVAETLVEVDASGRLTPGLAERWEILDDGLTWRFYLRDGVAFHDGAKFDAAAAVNSLNRARAKPGVMQEAPISAILSQGPLMVTVQLHSPYNPLGALMAHYTSLILSPASYEADGGVRRLYGTGPYRLVSVSPPSRVEITRFDDYWGTPAIIPHATYLTGHRPESRALQVMSGQTDIIYTLDPASLDLLRRQEDVRVVSSTIPRTIQLKLNAGHPFLAEREARQALSLAIDRAAIASRIIRVPGTEADQLAPPMLDDWHVASLPPLPRDGARAARLLAGLGWRPGPDGILRRGGEAFRLRLLTYADRPELVTVATAVQAQLRQIGIQADVVVDNSSAVPAGHLDGTLEMALVARNYGNIADPLGVFIADFGGPGGGEWGAMNWDSPEALSYLERLKAEREPDRYRELAQGLSALLTRELPVIPVVFYTQQTAVSGRVRNFTFDPFERNFHIASMYFADP